LRNLKQQPELHNIVVYLFGFFPSFINLLIFLEHHWNWCVWIA